MQLLQAHVLGQIVRLLLELAVRALRLLIQ
jgi:hypothetical protein